MSSPSYEIYFRTATFENVSNLLCTFADYRNDKGQSSWTYPRNHEHFDLIIEQDENDWDEFIEDIELEFFDAFFEQSLPSCCLSVERGNGLA